MPSKQSASGMSLSDLQKKLGITNVTPRQFRRYATQGVFPPGLIKKNFSGDYVVVRPPENESGWEMLRCRVESWREGRYERGWAKRPRATEIEDAHFGSESSGHLTLEAIHMDFLRWKSRIEVGGFPSMWNEEQHKNALELLRPMAEVINTSIAAVRALSKLPQRLE
jgi:hypothetical protein